MNKAHTYFLRVIIGIGLLIALIIISTQTPKNKKIDLVQNIDWSHFMGAKTTKKGIHFQPINHVIVHQDGSIGQPNPPVNIGGQHLKMKGDFIITITFSKIDQWASFRLYAEPPLVYDQWRHEGPSIDLAVAKDLVTVRIWNGSSSNAMDIREYKKNSPTQTTISLKRIKDQIYVIQDSETLGNLPDHNIFQSGNIWFGADGNPESKGWTLTALGASALKNGRMEIISAPSLTVDQSSVDSLRHLGDIHPRKLKIGASISVGPLFTDEQYRKLALNQFSILTPENSMKPAFIHPQPNLYTFENADLLVDAAQKNNIIVHGHTLLYDKSTPDWMTKTPKSERQKIMLDHVTQVVDHFKGKVAEWDVVNEPFSQKRAPYKDEKNGLETNIWFEAMGEKYIDFAFKAAHTADPAAKLYLNDYGLENDGEHWDSMLGLVKRLKARGVPIDGIGFEAHVYGDGDYIYANQLKNHMESLAALGLLTRISEIDVTQDDAKEQINQYEIALDTCLRATNCTSYTTWGIADRYGSTTRSDRYPLVHGTSLLWDKDMNPKPAYQALQKRLQQR